jgi:hypothetical protein
MSDPSMTKDGKPRYYVWDAINQIRSEAGIFFADDEQDAAIQYAEADTDGEHEGIYATSGHVLHVEAPGGIVTAVTVAVDYEPQFHCVRSEPVP